MACEHTQIAYNSCRNRHCPKCQASAAKRWLAARQTELLPVDYYHVVFTLPQPISDLAYYNKSVMYGLLLKAAAKTLLTIGADTKHLGARLGVTFVLHTWGMHRYLFINTSVLGRCCTNSSKLTTRHMINRIS